MKTLDGLTVKNYDLKQVTLLFVTLRTRNRQPSFGYVEDVSMCLSPLGLDVHQTWLEIPARFPKVSHDRYVIMPNHLHGILALDLQEDPSSPKEALEWFMQKTSEKAQEERLWARNFQEFRIYNQSELENLRDYIDTNPSQWDLDAENVAREAFL